MTTQFSVETPEKYAEVEKHLTQNVYLSGKTLPGQEDAQLLAQIKDAPDRTQFPHTYAWWWTLALFRENVRATWGQDPAKKTDTKKADGKKTDPKTGDDKKTDTKTEEKKVEKKDDDDLDLFADDPEAEAEAQKLKEATTAKKEADKKEKKVIIAKSRVVFDVKGYETEQDFDALGKRVMAEIKKDGLVWQDTFKVLPIAFGMKKLQMTMIIEDDKISADDILEEIAQKWEDEVQSCDIVEFVKA